MLSISTTNRGAGFAITGTSSQERIDTSIERLSTGKRINAAKDDAAGLSISTRLAAEIMGLNQATRNAADAQALLDTADSGLKEIGNLLLRRRQLFVQLSNGTLSQSDKTAINVEEEQLKAQIKDISLNTKWGGINLLDGSFSNKNIQVSTGTSGGIDISIGNGDYSSGSTNLAIGAEQNLLSGGLVRGTDFVTSNGDDEIYFVSIKSKSFAGSPIHPNPTYPYFHITKQNVQTGSNEEIIIGQSDYSNLYYIWNSEIHDVKILENGKLALSYLDPEHSHGSQSYLGNNLQLAIIDLENKILEYPTHQQWFNNEVIVDPLDNVYPNGTSTIVSRSRIIDLGNSNFAVVWSPDSGGGVGTYTQLYNYDGTKIGSMQMLSTERIPSNQVEASDWTKIENNKIAGFLSNGHLLGFDVINNTTTFNKQVSLESIGNHSFITSTNEGLAVIFSEDPAISGTPRSLFIRRYSYTGAEIGTKTQLITTDDEIFSASYENLGGNEFINILYDDSGTKKLQRFDLTGTSYFTTAQAIGSGSTAYIFSGNQGTLYSVTEKVRIITLEENLMETIDSDLMSLSQVRSSIGALYNRLDTIIASHGKTSMNLLKANGLIKDADYALETAELAKNQILQQASIQMQVLRGRSGDNILALLSSNSFLY